MFSIRYIRLISVAVSHNFYASGNGPDFVFVPTVDSQRIMKNLKLRMLPEPTGFSIALQVDSDVSPTSFRPFINPSQAFRLRFYMLLKNPRFFTLTQLPDTVATGHAFYLTNRFNKQLAGTPPTLLLTGHDGGDNNVSGSDLVRVVSGKFKHQLSAPNALVTISDSYAAVPTVVWPTPDSPQGEGNIIECDLADLPDGRYQLEEDNGFTVELYKDNQFAQAAGFGLIELFSDSPAADFRFIEPQGDGTVIAHQRNYQIMFLTRSTFWRYFVIAQSAGVNLNTFSIAGNFSTTTVPASILARYGSGNVSLWESDDPIPLSDSPSTVVDYNYNPPGPNNASGQLPSPGLGATGPRRDDSGNIIVDGTGVPIFFSEEYVIL